MKKLAALLCLTLVVSLLAPSARADTLTGEVRGSVLDVDGRVPLEGVPVTLVNVDRGWERRTLSDGQGNFLFIQLEPGNYTVVVEYEGYYRVERTDVLIRLNQPKVVIPPFELRRLVPTATQQITLRGEQTRTAVIDLTAPGPTPRILAFLSEPGLTSLVGLLDSALRFNFETRLVDRLPLRGVRSFDQLALLAPGVFRVPFSPGEGPAVGLGVGTPGQFAVNGLRGRSNNFTVDGSDNNDEDIGVRRQGFVSLVSQSIESVQEFQILTAGFPAEFGRNAGSMVNAVSRSGQRRTHGSVYGIFGHDALSRSGPFDTPFSDTVNDPRLSGGSWSGQDFSQSQWGGVLGGQVVPEKLFYFLSAERQRLRARRLGHFVVPSAGERGLRTRDGLVPMEDLEGFFAARNIPYSTLAGEGVYSLYPLPNNPGGPFGASTYTQSREADGAGSIFSLKTDWYPADGHSFAARYNFTQDHRLLPFTGDALESSLHTATRTQNLSLFLNSPGPRLGNVLRLSYGRTRLRFPPEKGSPLLFGSPPTAQLPAELGHAVETDYGRFGPFGATGPIGQLTILPYSTIGVDVFNFPQGRVDNTFQISDFLTLAGSRHNLKLGFDLRRSQLNSFSDRNSRPWLLFGYGLVGSGCLSNPLCPFATPDGLLHGTDLAALGAPAGFLQTLSTGPLPDTTIGLRVLRSDFFLQNEWRVTRGLLLNLGLRYEIQSVPRETNRRIEATFEQEAADFPRLEPSGSPLHQQIIREGNRGFDDAFRAFQELLAGRREIYQGGRHNLAPRLGFAWDPWGAQRTTIRGGIFVSTDANLGAVTSHSRNVFPTFVPLNLDPNFSPPTGLFLNNPSFFTFLPTGTPLVRPGTLNTYNLSGDAFATGLGTLFLQAERLPGIFSSNGLALTLPEKGLRASQARQAVLSVERQFGENLLVSLGYVGTRGLRLTRFATPNAGPVATPVLLSPAPGPSPLGVFSLPPSPTGSGVGRPESGLGAYRLFENAARSVYHSFQTVVEKRWSRGLQFRAHWTWSHALDEVSDPFDGRGFIALPQDSLRPHLERASASFDVRHRGAGFLLWEPGRLSGLNFLRGWSLAFIAEFATGQPYTVNTALDRNFDGNLTDRPDSLQGVRRQPGSPEALRLEPGVDPLDLLAPRGQSGRVGRNSLRADGIGRIDVAVARRLSWIENRELDLRLEVFNLLNRTSYGIPVRLLESLAFGRSFDTQFDPRSARLVVRFLF